MARIVSRRVRLAPTNRVGRPTKPLLPTDVAAVPTHDSRVIFFGEALVVSPGRRQGGLCASRVRPTSDGFPARAAPVEGCRPRPRSRDCFTATGMRGALGNPRLPRPDRRSLPKAEPTADSRDGARRLTAVAVRESSPSAAPSQGRCRTRWSRSRSACSCLRRRRPRSCAESRQAPR